MCKVTENIPKRCGYTIIYYEVVERLGISYDEYIILDIMLLESKKNEYKKGVEFLHRKTKIAINTIKKRIDNLYSKKLVLEKKGTNYYLDISLKKLLEPEESGVRGLKIYHQHMIELNLKLNQYVVLYLYYSFSRNRLSKEAYSGYEQYKNFVEIDERQFYRVRKKLINYNLIKKARKDHVELSPNIFNWFKVQENIK